MEYTENLKKLNSILLNLVIEYQFWRAMLMRGGLIVIKLTLAETITLDFTQLIASQKW